MSSSPRTLTSIRFPSRHSLHHPANAGKSQGRSGLTLARHAVSECRGLLQSSSRLYGRERSKAFADFQTVIENSGWPEWELYEPLSQLGLAQAYAKQGDSENSRKTYDNFFATWKDADPDIPILKQAKAEYAKRALSSTSSRRVQVPLAPK